MITHEDAMAAHERAAVLRCLADGATREAARKEGRIYSLAYAEAKHREALAAVQTATAQSLWASWTMRVRP